MSGHMLTKANIFELAAPFNIMYSSFHTQSPPISVAARIKVGSLVVGRETFLDYTPRSLLACWLEVQYSYST